MQFHCLLPLHEQELRFAMARGTGALMHRMIQAKVSDVVDVKRASVV